MSQDDQNLTDELQSLIRQLESYAPTRGQTEGVRVIYRSVGGEEVIEDSMPSEEINESDAEPAIEDTEIAAATQFQALQTVPVAAVDCGIVRLGETENGLVIALRSAIIIDSPGDSKVTLFRTGPIYLHNHYKKQILHQMGAQLGRPDLFVDLDTSVHGNGQPIRVKSGVADDAHQYGDRFRNWFERLIQKIAASTIENGILLLDGALTLRTRDTPDTFLEQLSRLSNEKGNAIVAVSKQSVLQIQGKPIRFWLSDMPNSACYRPLTPLMRSEGRERALGNVYASRFSSLGPTLRMDVKALDGQSYDEAIGQFFSSTLMRGGYPDILVRAHAHSYFTSPDVIQLQAQAGAKYSLVPQAEVELTGIFAPFGGRYK